MAIASNPERRWSALALIVTAQFMVILDVAIVNVALPSIKADLGFSQTSLQWVISAYAILFGGTLLLGGRLADLLGRRRLFIAGLALFAGSSLLCGLAWSAGSLIAFRGLQGLGGALLAPAALSLLMTTFAEGKDRNVALGIYGAASGSGAAAGVLLGGVLTSYVSWSWIFFINVPVAVAAIALTPVLLRDSRADLQHRHFDFAGAASVTAGLMLLVYAMTRATSDGWVFRNDSLAAGRGHGASARVRPDRVAVAVSAPAAADLQAAYAHGGQRRDGDRRGGRVLRVLPPDAVSAGRSALLGGPERRRVRGVRADGRGGIERCAGGRPAARRAADAHRGAARVCRLRRLAHPPACGRALLTGMSFRASCSAAQAWRSRSSP